MWRKAAYTVFTIALVVAVVVAILTMRLVRGGFSARDQPSAAEAIAARTMRRLAVPERARNLANPVYPSDEALNDARAHFADHCATCHANDGSGDTPIGRNLYPKAPDMRLAATQSLTDGELYAIIQDGIRLTGMPAWGQEGDDNADDSWKLVLLIRRLKDLTPEQLDQMEQMNPKSADELEQERHERAFLAGEPGSPTPPRKPAHEHQ